MIFLLIYEAEKNGYRARTFKATFQDIYITFFKSNFSFDNASNEPKLLCDVHWNAFEGSMFQFFIKVLVIILYYVKQC